MIVKVVQIIILLKIFNDSQILIAKVEKGQSLKIHDGYFENTNYLQAA